MEIIGPYTYKITFYANTSLHTHIYTTHEIHIYSLHTHTNIIHIYTLHKYINTMHIHIIHYTHIYITYIYTHYTHIVYLYAHNTDSFLQVVPSQDSSGGEPLINQKLEGNQRTGKSSYSWGNDGQKYVARVVGQRQWKAAGEATVESSWGAKNRIKHLRGQRRQDRVANGAKDRREQLERGRGQVRKAGGREAAEDRRPLYILMYCFWSLCRFCQLPSSFCIMLQQPGKK